jgi:hypothetical protein
VVLGSRVPGLRQQLAQADVQDWDGLWEGELEPEETEAAPHLVLLKREAAFTQWLMAEAATAFGGWGLLVRSARSFLQMRSHGRALGRATLPDGHALRLDWADPPVLEAVLPLARPEQLEQVFTAVESIVITAPAEWTRHTLVMGKLVSERSAVLVS